MPDKQQPEQADAEPDQADAEPDQADAEPDQADAEPGQAQLTKDDLGRDTRSRVPVVLMVVGALLAGFLVARATTGGDDGGTEAPADGGTATDDGLAFPSGDQNRTGYWGFAGLEPTVIDTFDRADDPTSLGDAGSGQSWEPVNGTWGIRDDSALSSGGSGTDPFLAVVPEGTGDGLTEVTMTVMEEGAGLVFRYLDPRNYWSVTANPGVGSWSVNRVIDGESELVGEALGPTNDGVTVSVTQDGSTVRILLEGEEKLLLTDAALGDQLQGGIIAASTTTGDARWDRFLVMRFRETDGATTTTAAP